MNNKKNILIISLNMLLLSVFLVIFYFSYIVPTKKQIELDNLVKEYIDNKLSTYADENSLYKPGEVDVVFLGDSLTDGCDLSLYYPNYVTLNRGIGGDTTFRLQERLQVSVYDVQPKVVVMLIGGNNLNNMFDNYESIVKGLKTNLANSEIVLVSLTAMGKDWKHKNEIAINNNIRIEQIAIQYSCHYVEVFSSLYDTKTQEIYSHYTIDGAHLTHEGYLVLTGLISAKLDEILKKV